MDFGKKSAKRLMKSLYWLAFRINVYQLRSKNVSTRLGAVVSLGHLHEILGTRPEIEPHLIRALQDPDSRVRAQATLSLKWNGFIKDSIPFLRQVLKDEDSNVRARAVYALSHRRDLINDLIPMLEDEDAKVRENTVIALANLADKDAVPLLLKAVQDKAVQVRRMVVHELGEIGDARALPTLEYLEENDFTKAWEGIKGKEDYQDITISDFATTAIEKIKKR